MAASNERALKDRVTALRELARAADTGMRFLWVCMWRDRSAGAEALKAVQQCLSGAPVTGMPEMLLLRSSVFPLSSSTCFAFSLALLASLCLSRGH